MCQRFLQLGTSRILPRTRNLFFNLWNRNQYIPTHPTVAHRGVLAVWRAFLKRSWDNTQLGKLACFSLVCFVSCSLKRPDVTETLLLCWPIQLPLVPRGIWSVINSEGNLKYSSSVTPSTCHVFDGHVWLWLLYWAMQIKNISTITESSVGHRWF